MNTYVSSTTTGLITSVTAQHSGRVPNLLFGTLVFLLSYLSNVGEILCTHFKVFHVCKPRSRYMSLFVSGIMVLAVQVISSA